MIEASFVYTRCFLHSIEISSIITCTSFVIDSCKISMSWLLLRNFFLSCCYGDTPLIDIIDTLAYWIPSIWICIQLIILLQSKRRGRRVMNGFQNFKGITCTIHLWSLFFHAPTNTPKRLALLLYLLLSTISHIQRILQGKFAVVDDMPCSVLKTSHYQ